MATARLAAGAWFSFLRCGFAATGFDTGVPARVRAGAGRAEVWPCRIRAPVHIGETAGIQVVRHHPVFHEMLDLPDAASCG